MDATTTSTPPPKAAACHNAPTILPLRLLHWLLAASFAGAWITAESERWRDLHMLLGYTLFGLVALRLLWHAAAGPRARIVAFLAGPARTWRALRARMTGTGDTHIGHNAVGAWAIVAVMALALVTTLTGYMTFQDIGGEAFAELHEGAANMLLFGAIAHVVWIAGRTLLRRFNSPGATPTRGTNRTVVRESLLSPRRLAAIALVVAVGGFWALALRGDLPLLLEPDRSAGNGSMSARHGHVDD